jgi:hypothetical protein
MVKIISWIGTATSIAGSFIVASQMFLLGYCFFLVGSVSWLYVGAVRREASLVVLNGTFFAANLLGLYNAAF